MKKLIVLIPFLLLSWNSFSQGLKPIVFPIKGKDHFCFTAWQAKYIAKSLEKVALQDSLITKLEQQSNDLLVLQQFKDTTIDQLEQKVSNQSLLIENKELSNTELRRINKKLNRKSKRRGFKNGLLGSALLIVTGILIAQ